MKGIKAAALFFISLLLLTCGLEEYYFLPQVNDIITSFNTSAVANLPPIDSYNYATSYTIFYRIYASQEDVPSISISDLGRINPSLQSDYSTFSTYIDPTNTTAVTTQNTFSSRNFFKLELEGINIDNVLSTKGGELRIMFPTATGGFPFLSLDGGSEMRLARSRDLISPEPDRSFLASAELRDYANATADKNADVAGRSGDMPFAYVSMYIVATGYNSVQFSPIYSKPAHINIFRLPAAN
jgi:hypothetical protein